MSIFNEENDPSQKVDQVDPSQPSSLETMLSEIRNENGEPKYASVEEALKGLVHANQFISTLKSEKKQLEEEVNARKAVEDALKGLSSKDESSATPPTINPDDINALVQQRFSEYESKRAEVENVSKCEASLKAKYGDKASRVLKETAEKLGRSTDELQTLAAKDPALFMGLFQGVQQKETAPTVGGKNTLGFQSKPESVVKRNSESLFGGGDVKSEFANARKMVEELNESGHTVYDLTDPKVYFKMFGK